MCCILNKCSEMKIEQCQCNAASKDKMARKCGHEKWALDSLDGRISVDMPEWKSPCIRGIYFCMHMGDHPLATALPSYHNSLPCSAGSPDTTPLPRVTFEKVYGAAERKVMVSCRASFAALRIPAVVSIYCKPYSITLGNAFCFSSSVLKRHEFWFFSN